MKPETAAVTHSDQPTEQVPPADPPVPLVSRISLVGGELASTFQIVLDALPGAPQGPQKLARDLGLDKALASRILRAVSHPDPIATVHLAPGPEPLRRLVRAARRQGAPAELIGQATEAVDRFEQLIRNEAGDRSSFNAILSAFLPEARQEFELRSKQTAYKGMSQIRGVMAETTLTTVILTPSDDGARLDVLFILGLLGIRRLRPDAQIKLATRRSGPHEGPRAPAVTLGGETIDGIHDARLDEFCAAPPANLKVQQVGDVNLYTLGGEDFGPKFAVDLLLAEVNPAGMQRYSPPDEMRMAAAGADIYTPTRKLCLDVFLPDDVFPGSDPQLVISDTSFDGSGNINDPTRMIDRYDMLETVQLIGRDDISLRMPEFPRYPQLVRHVFDRMGWERHRYRGYRCRVDYPIFGSEVILGFDRPAPPA